MFLASFATTSEARPAYQGILFNASIVLHLAMEALEVHAPWLGVALVSISAVFLGYLYVSCKKEAAVSFNVPLPPEVRANWPGKNWEDVQGEERKVLEGQARGASSVQSVFFSRRRLTCLTAMEQGFDHELLSCGWKSTRNRNQTCDS